MSKYENGKKDGMQEYYSQCLHEAIAINQAFIDGKIEKPTFPQSVIEMLEAVNERLCVEE